MTAENARVELVLVGRDEASAAVRSLTASMAALETKAKALTKLFSSGMGADLARDLGQMVAQAKALSNNMGQAGEKVAEALRSDTAAARELRDALREVADAQGAVARGARSTSGRSSGSSSSDTGQRGRETASDALRNVKTRWKIREASQAAELRHVSAVRREREAIHRSAMRAGREAYQHGRHAVRSVNHPALESPGHAAALGAAFGGAAVERIVEASVAFDTSMSRLRMFAPQLDADSIRRQALTDSITLGVSADKIVDSISKSVRDGVPPAIAESLPKSIAQTAQIMGGDIERLTDSLAEGIQEATSMGWIKDKLDARRFLNLEAGLSTTAGNTSQKTEQFIAAGGLGHGKEMGLDLEKTMAFGAMLNSSGARTGQASARFMGQLSQNIPKMFDLYRSAVQSHNNTEENRAVRSAPSKLGYGNIREMQKRLEEGPEGVLDFATRLQQLDDKSRKLVLQGFHFSEQGGAMLAELGSNGGTKGKAVLARAHELAEQKESNDYLTSKFAEWSKSLAFMIQKMTAGWYAIENEIGDVFKTDLVTPFRDWWVDLSKAIVGGNLRERVHGALMSFVNGLGFEDVAALLKSLSSNVGGFDIAGFARGLGEGIRKVVDDFRYLSSAFSFGGMGVTAETIGKLAAEMFGLSLALHAIAPVVTAIGGIVSGFLALKAVLAFGGYISELTGITAALKGIVGVELASTAAGLVSFAGALGVISAAVQALLSTGILPKVTLLPRSTTKEGVDDWLWGKNKDGSSARPAWVDRLTGGSNPGEGLVKGPHGGLVPSPQSYQGANCRDLMTPAAYATDDASAGDHDRDSAAMIGTSRAAQRIADMLEKIASKGSMTASTSSLSTVAGFDGGGGDGGGNANLRYGRGAAGGYRSTPGTGSYGDPSKSLLNFIAQAEGGGYNVTQGNGRYLPGGKEQNLTGKSLNEILALGKGMIAKSGSSAMGRYQITGQTIRDLMKRMGLNGSEKYDEKMQDAMASRLIHDEGPRALQRWEGLKRGGRMAQAQALLRAGSIASLSGSTGVAGKVAGVNPVLQAMIKRASQIAGVPLGIYSGYRSPEHNAAVGGAGRSLHMQGLASDLTSPGHNKKDGAFWARINKAMAQAAAELHQPYRWGGNFPGKYAHDNDHFDLTGAGASSEAMAAVKAAADAANASKLAKDTSKAITKDVPLPAHPAGRHPAGGAGQSADASTSIVNHFHIHGGGDHDKIAHAVMAKMGDQRRHSYADASIG